jgi:hypothetical protein
VTAIGVNGLDVVGETIQRGFSSGVYIEGSSTIGGVDHGDPRCRARTRDSGLCRMRLGARHVVGAVEHERVLVPGAVISGWVEPPRSYHNCDG